MAQDNKTSSTDVVTIGCKLPHGLHMDVGGQRITLAGENSTEIVGGHGLTYGVPKDFWEAWKKEHAEQPFVKNGLVFAQGKTESAIAEAKEKQNNKTGFEGIDPANPGKGVNSIDAKIERAPENDKK